ncbi:MAG: sensor histidine kinase [Bacteroidia bacterium]
MQSSYERKRIWKMLLLLAAMAIGVFSLWYTNRLVKALAIQEEKKITLWANATKQLINSEGDINFLLDIIKDNETIPTILVDDNGNIITTRNLDSTRINDTAYLARQLEEMKAEHEPIVISYDNERYNYLYYKNSTILLSLKRYPYIQLALIAFFAIMSYLALSSSRRAEQNQVWVGMSKETAHQLGTPISSLKEWINLLKETDEQAKENIISELNRDIQRLELITERFSKIGSEPVLKAENLDLVVEKSIAYLQKRVSSKVKFSVNIATPGNWAYINIPLFDWVMENLCKNAVDAMNGSGSININLNHNNEFVYIDISDTGKGIPRSKFKTVFKPGYTTKKRGWGLGLSLVKRIIKDYHKGKIFVKQSEPGKGTTFRIILKSA